MSYDLPLSYLIGADEERVSPAIGRVIEGPYDAPQINEPGGQDIAYCNLFHENLETEGPIYGPYLPDDDTSAEYGEGRIDPRGDGWRRNLDRQYALRREQGHTCLEFDNPDSYEDFFDAVLAELDNCGFDCIAKNPVILSRENATAYVRHPRVIGMVIEKNDNDPADCVEVADQLRIGADKLTMPVWFVSFGEQSWANAIAAAIRTYGYKHMGVTHSTRGEYENTTDILPYQTEKPPMAGSPPWLNVMRSLIGTKEAAGSANNPVITGMADTISGKFPDMRAYCDQSPWNEDATPWCGLSAANCMALSDIRPPFGKTDTTRWGWAKAWSTDPGFAKISSPRLGCVVVLGREGGGHVTFYERTEGSRYICTGGNQGDAINTSGFPVSNLIGLYWPADVDVGPEPPAERRELEEGMTGPDVMALQKALGIPADGEFGPVTETWVTGFQAACGNLDVDGVVGEGTWAEVDALTARMAAGSTGLSKELEAEIVKLADDSALADYSWPGRGMPPPGYVPGLALCYAVAVRAYQAGDSAMVLCAAGEAGNDEKDALAWLADEFKAIGMVNTADGLTTLRGLFVLLYGLGMRESSGDCYEGRDLSASNISAETCESSLFQTSWNIKAASVEIPPMLEEHWDNPQGFLPVFAETLNPTVSNLKCFGTGDGARYQWLARYSPLFCTMVTAVGCRTLGGSAGHWGPIRRKEVTLNPSADVLLLAVQHLALAVPPVVEPPPVEPPPLQAEVTIVVRSKGNVLVTVIEEGETP